MLLGMTDDHFARFVKELFETEAPPTHAMAVVGYMNMDGYLRAYEHLAQREGKVFDVDDFARIVFKEYASSPQDEIKQRRSSWFFMGTAALRLNRKAATNPALRSAAVDVWIMMASSGKYLKALLEHNVVWSDKEKEWFAGLRNEKDGIRYVINFAVPKLFHDDPAIMDLAKQNDIWILGQSAQ
jgi:hypothetical protein